MPGYGHKAQLSQRGPSRMSDPLEDDIEYWTERIVTGLAIGAVATTTAPIWGPAVLAFLAAHSGISANAFWGVVKAIKRKQNPVKAGAKAGVDAAGVALIEEFVKKWLKYIPSSQ